MKRYATKDVWTALLKTLKPGLILNPEIFLSNPGVSKKSNATISFDVSVDLPDDASLALDFPDIWLF